MRTQEDRALVFSQPPLEPQCISEAHKLLGADGCAEKRVMVSNFTRTTLLWVHLFSTLCCVRSVIFPKRKIYKAGCLHALDLIY